MISQKKHTYEYSVDLNSDAAPARVVRLTGQRKRVLEIGAGPGSITKHLKQTNECQVTAIELDSDAIKLLSQFCERVYRLDLNEPSWADSLKDEARFDVVIAADVLEHLYDPAEVLKRMVTFLKNDGCLIISLPHIGHSSIHACMYAENFEYGDWGLLDRTHIRFFGIKNMQKLFDDSGLKIVEAEFVVRSPEHTEFTKQWAMTPRELRNCLGKNPFGSVYQVVVKAVPVEGEGVAVTLLNLPVERRSGTFKESISAFLRLHLSPKMYGKVIRLKQAVAAAFH